MTLSLRRFVIKRYQAFLEGINCSLCAVGEVELGEDIRDVCSHSWFADGEFAGNLVI